MQKITKVGAGTLFGSMVFLFFLVVFQNIMEIPAWLAVAGRMHPMFLHFPIVLLLLSFFTVWIPNGKSAADQWLNLLRLSAALSASITAIMGMLLSFEDGRSGETLELHKWGGVIVAVLGYLFYAYSPQLSRYILFTRSFTVIATAAIIFTGHWGADLTHGSDYVLAPINGNQQHIVPPDQAIIFADVIQPILEKKCAGCHGESSTKGKLKLSDLKSVLAGGKSGALFIPGNPDTSLLIHRIHLPLEDKKRMPPASKPQLTETEAAVLYDWIKSGAAAEVKLFSLPATDSFRILATAYLTPGGENTAAAEPVYSFEAADEKKIIAVNNNYRVVVPLGKNSPALVANVYGRNVYTSKSLEELLPLKEQIVELNLARMPVKDDDMKVIQQMPNLRRLNLNYTDITDNGIALLSNVKSLREVALSGTATTANALEKILPLPDLSSIYIWDTKIDSTALQRLRTKFPKLVIESGFVDNGAEIMALSAPVIKPAAGIFEKDIQAEIKHPFKGVEIRYTTDGSEPDSVNSPVYAAPFAITKNTVVKARAFKPGWYGSNAAQSSFIHRSMKPDSVILITPTDAKYKPTSEKALTDGEIGSFDNVANGDWYGYQKDDAEYYMLFNKPAAVKSVTVIAAKNIGRYLFPPEVVEVWGGADQKNLKLLGTIEPKPAQKGELSEHLQLQVAFPSTEVQCLKIIAKHLRTIPAWHGGKGQAGWIFVSEVVLD
ncbi:MAG: chitobiase/beta-hexosaminidase C-terminal domain-containing protein [Chitinophagaceae bacterium]|nr:chitobiase/beta-hexosaminidase C-terminal domain-containing protein [Chitinophagaceae bacterium]